MDLKNDCRLTRVRVGDRVADARLRKPNTGRDRGRHWNTVWLNTCAGLTRIEMTPLVPRSHDGQKRLPQAGSKQSLNCMRRMRSLCRRCPTRLPLPRMAAANTSSSSCPMAVRIARSRVSSAAQTESSERRRLPASTRFAFEGRRVRRPFRPASCSLSRRSAPAG